MQEAQACQTDVQVQILRSALCLKFIKPSIDLCLSKEEIMQAQSQN